MDKTLRSIFPDDDKSRERLLINELVTLRTNTIEERTWTLESILDSEPCLGHPKSLHSLPEWRHR